jgi:predicted O-methyltransferase YrrM
VYDSGAGAFVKPRKSVARVFPEPLKLRLKRLADNFDVWLNARRASGISYLARPLLKQDDLARDLFDRVETKGIHILPVHYYSPVPDTRELRSGDQGWRREVDLADIRFDLQKQSELGEAFKAYGEEIKHLPDAEDLRVQGYGLGYGPIEAMVLHCFIRHFRPKRIIEVGSGVSTVYEANAIYLNAKDGNGPCRLTCIEPFPSDRLRSISEVSEVIERKVQEVPVDLLRTLEAGDILFIDSSHSVKVGSDVNYLYMNVLPALRSGVLVHIHDIYFPYLAPPDMWLFGKMMFWQETVLLKALLSGSREFEVVYCTSYLHHKEPGKLAETFPSYDPRVHYPQSIWLRKLSPDVAREDK